MSQSANIPPIPQNIWTEYQDLSKTQRGKELSTNQRKRLIELTDIIEDIEVKRYEKLMKLGEKLKMTIPELKKKLDIGIQRSY